MNESVKISVIVPAYNVGPWLRRCLESICCQTHTNLEILVIDDGATDDTGAIIDGFAQADPRVVAIHQQNAGLVAAREVGIRRATGEYVGFVDGDDTIEPDMFARLLANALEFNADISHCGVAFVWPDGQSILHYGTGQRRVQNNIEGQRALLDGREIEPTLCSKLYRATLLSDSCLDSTVLNNEDLLRNFVLFQRAQTSVYEDFCGYHYIQREGSMSKNQRRQAQAAWHVFRARQLIVEHSSPDVYPYAMRSWLSCAVNLIHTMPEEPDPELAVCAKEFRQFLHDHQRELHYLIPRQQLAAWLILYAPGLQRKLYQIYRRRS